MAKCNRPWVSKVLPITSKKRQTDLYGKEKKNRNKKKAVSTINVSPHQTKWPIQLAVQLRFL